MEQTDTLIQVLDPHAQPHSNYGSITAVLRWTLSHYTSVTRMKEEKENFGAAFLSCLRKFEELVYAMQNAPDSLLSSRKKEINPYFIDIFPKKKDSLVFVLMPFTEDWSNRIWTKHIKKIVEKIRVEPKLSCIRADDLFGTDVLKDIYKTICEARIIVADITSRNANVFYELGIAHALGKKVILLTQDTNDIPFDLLRFRHIIYADNSDGYEILNNQLEGAIIESLK